MAWRKNPTGLDQSVKKFLEDIRHHLATLIHGAGQFIRRDRVASVAAGLVLIGLLGGVIADAWLAHRAKLAEARAEQASTDARRLAHSRRIDRYDRFYEPGANRISESRVNDAITREVRQDLADVNNGLGSAAEEYRNTPLRTAATTSDDLVADNPRDRTSGRSFPMSYPNFGGAVFPTSVDLAAVNLTGDFLALIKKPQAAIVAFQKQIVIDEAVVAADPGNVQAQTDVAYSSSRIGDLLTELGDQAGALPYYQQAVNIYTKNAPTGQPQDPAASLQLGLLLGKLAITHARLGYADKAVAEINKAADLLEALPVDAANVEQQHARALVYGELGDAYSLLARDTRTPQKFMKQFWRAAHDMYAHSLEILGILRDQGVLNADQLTEIDTISQKIAESDVFLAK